MFNQQLKRKITSGTDAGGRQAVIAAINQCAAQEWIDFALDFFGVKVTHLGDGEGPLIFSAWMEARPDNQNYFIFKDQNDDEYILSLSDAFIIAIADKKLARKTAPDTEESSESTAVPTAIDRHLCIPIAEKIIKLFVQAAQQQSSNTPGANFRILSYTDNLEGILFKKLKDDASAASFRFSIDSSADIAEVALLSSSEIFNGDGIIEETPGDAQSDEMWRAKVFNAIMATPVKCEAVIDALEVTFERLTHMKPGDMVSFALGSQQQSALCRHTAETTVKIANCTIGAVERWKSIRVD